MPVAGAGTDMFEPTADESDQQPAQGQLGQQIDPSKAPMQPAQSPEEHAKNKQGWLDFFKDPSTSAFLMQFGASMLQPNVRGFGAQLGQSLGEGGQAVARMSEQEQARAKSQADVAEAQQRGALYGAEAKAQPELAQAKQMSAEAAAQVAGVKADTASQLIWIKGQLEQAQQAGDYARAQQLQAQADQIEQKMKYPGLSQYQQEHEKWAELHSQGLDKPGTEPQPEDFGVPRGVLGLPTQQFGAAAPGQLSVRNMPPYKDTPNFWNMVGEADAATRQQLAIEYVTNRKQISLDDWNAHVRDYDARQAAAKAASAPGTKGAGAGIASRPPGIGPAVVQPQPALTGKAPRFAMPQPGQ